MRRSISRRTGAGSGNAPARTDVPRISLARRRLLPDESALRRGTEIGRVKDENLGVAPGQRYRAAGSISSIWEVVTVARYPSEPLPHVRLVRVGAPQDR